jgi:hypothetical protein
MDGIVKAQITERSPTNLKTLDVHSPLCRPSSLYHFPCRDLAY